MEKINEYLQTLLSTCSYALHLEPNRTPYLVNANGETEVANSPLLGTQISTIVFPLIPASAKQQLPNQAEIEFVHNNNLGNFNFQIKKSPAGFNVTIRPMLSEVGDIQTGPAEFVSEQPTSIPTTDQTPTAGQFEDSPAIENETFKESESEAPPALAYNFQNQSTAVVEDLNPSYDYSTATIEIEDSDNEYEVAAQPAHETIASAAYQSEYSASVGPSYQAPSNSPSFTLAEDFASVEEEFEPVEARNPTPTVDASAYSPSSQAQQRMDTLFHAMANAGSSDLHLSATMPPMIRKDGKMMRLECGEDILSAEAMKQLLTSIMPKKNLEEFELRRDTDFAYAIEGLARFRANIFMDRKGMGGVFRIIPTKILTAEALGLPKAIMDLCSLSKGLVVVTGPTGSGKSTTLCAMVDSINKSREDHIITIEDPIEFVHENQKCLVNQREVHNHTSSFKDALRAALREDPDILLVGEMRDLETISIAIETAETGHLVFGTLHTTTAPSTVDRIIDQFPADRQQQIRVMLSESLRGVIAQTLLPKKGGGRIAALEILIITPAISNLIREGKTFQIASSMQTGKNLGMVMLNDSLLELVKKDLVEPRDAYIKSVDKPGFESLLERNGFKI